MKYIIIHVGKCSGTALCYSLRQQKINYSKIHHAFRINPPEVSPEIFIEKYPDCQFIFCIRHPIDRIISAFNFKYTRVVIRKCKRHRRRGGQNSLEKEGLEYFKTIQNFAESLYNDDETLNEKAIKFIPYCDHIAFGLHHYLNNFNETHNIKIIRHENLKEDYKNIFDKDINIPDYSLQPNFVSNIDSKYKKTSEIQITKKAYNNLKKYLKKDFDIIDRLEKYNLITKEYKDYCFNKLPENIVIN